MRFLSYTTPAGMASYGLLLDIGIVDLARRLPQAPDLQALIATGNASMLCAGLDDAPADWQPNEVRMLPVIPQPRTVVCVGHNYEEHRRETQRDPTEHPSIFLRTAESLQAAGEALLMPRESDQFDYEGELAVVIGRAGRRIAEADAWAHVFGFACFNEASVRDWQHHSRQFTPGKNFPRTGAFGPHLVTLDEAGPNPDLKLQTRLNGQVVQQARTSQMIFPIPEILAYVSTFITLQPGDVIATGTPGGVGAKRNPPLWMRDGDKVEIEIEGVGLLQNTVRRESAGA